MMHAALVRAIAVIGCTGSIAVATFATQTALEQNAERAAREGWAAARSLVAVGAPPNRLGPVSEWLREIERQREIAAQTSSLDGARLELSLRYADAAIRAAIAAAQDERDDMTVFLKHARSLDQQIASLRSPAVWPVPIDELEGELYFEVDRYDEAHQAYLRAIANGGGPHAWMGLARTNDRLGSTLAACDAYRRASAGALGEAERVEAVAYLNSARCQR